ncbi:MAG: hypothetical protein KUG77_00485, partial [Nannocystaceae bacterium]|nr:hypothetical protein [Nannocystaceae bacterium]
FHHDELRQLASAVGPSESATARAGEFQRATGGNTLRLFWALRHGSAGKQTRWEGLEHDLDSLVDPASTHLLQAAAVFNGRFTEDELLAVVGDGSASALEETLREGWLGLFADGRLGFPHDQLREAVLLQTSETQIRHWNRTIGLVQLASRTPMRAVWHLNRVPGLDAPGIRERLIELNLRAAEFETASGSAASALEYCDAAERHIEGSAHAGQVLRARANALFLAERWSSLHRLPHHTRWCDTSAVERAEVDTIRVLGLLSQGALADAVELCCRSVGVLGEAIPEATDFEGSVRALNAARAEAPSEAAEVSTRQQTAMAALIMATIPAFYQAAPTRCGFASAILLRLCRGGTLPDAMPYAVAACASAYGLANEQATALEVGNHIVELVRDDEATLWAPRAMFVYDCLISHHREGPTPRVVGRLLETYQQALEVGDLDHACYAHHIAEAFRFLGGCPLPEAARRFRNVRATLVLNRQPHIERWNCVYQELIETLTQHNRPTTVLHGAHFSELVSERELDPNVHVRVGLAHLVLALVFRNPSQGLDAARRYREFPPATRELHEAAVFLRLGAIAYYEAAKSESETASRTALFKEGDALADTFRAITGFRAEQPGHLHLLLDGCRLWAQGEQGPAAETLQRAAEQCWAAGASLEACIAAERLADCTGRPEHLVHAVEKFAAWGAHAKVTRLDASTPRSGLDVEAALRSMSEASDPWAVLAALGRHLQANAGSSAVHINTYGVWSQLVPGAPTPRTELPVSVLRDLRNGADVLSTRTHPAARHGDPSRGSTHCLAMALRIGGVMVATLYCPDASNAAELDTTSTQMLQRLAAVAVHIVEGQLLRTSLEHRVDARTRELSESLSKLRKAQARVQTLERLTTTSLVVGGLSHELGTPLAGARVVTDALRACADSGTAEAFRERARRGLSMLDAHLQSTQERIRHAAAIVSG